MVVISYRERNCKFLSGEAFTYKSKLYRGGRCCVMRFVSLTLLTGKTFSRANRGLFKKKIPRFLSSNWKNRTSYFSRENIEPMSPHRIPQMHLCSIAKKPVHVVTLRLRCSERTRTKLKIRYLSVRSSGRGELRSKTRGWRLLLDYVCP